MRELAQVNFFSHKYSTSLTPSTSFIAMSRQRKRKLNDKSHTFLVPAELAQSSSLVEPLAVIDKVSADYRRTLPQKYSVREPTPPLQSFFDDLALYDNGLGNEDIEDLSTMPTDIDHSKDSLAERRKLHAPSVSHNHF
jgi:hypothetical protein